MKNLILALAVVVGLGFATPAFAAMPNFIGTGYKQAENCTLSTDRHVWELVGSNFIKVGCITQEAHEAAEAAARAAQDKTTGLRFGVGQSVTLRTGAVETCPFWFPQYAGCTIARSLVR